MTLDDLVPVFQHSGKIHDREPWGCQICSRHVSARQRTRHVKYHHAQSIRKGNVIVIRNRTIMMSLEKNTMRQHYEQLLKDTICRLPKHDGETWWFVFTRDERYARWCVNELEEMDEEIREALQFLLDS